MSDQRSNWISKRAYALWEQAGCPLGRDQDHWLQASTERELMERTMASVDGNEVMTRTRGGVDEIGLNHGTVLVVEDEPQLRFDTVDVLENAGYATQEAANADEALVLLRNRPFDTVITDINMPGSLDGLGLAAHIGSFWPRTKIIIASGLVRLRDQDLLPGVSFLAKPLAAQTLLTIMATPR